MKTKTAYKNELAKKRRWLTEGKCWQCGKLKRDFHASMCDKCGIRMRMSARKKKGFKGVDNSARFVYRDS